MSIIEYIHIENFRSIRSLRITGLADYNPITGLNSSGKSNILRALNLFFNGEVDEAGEPLYMPLDLSSHLPQRKKKLVAVTVGLNIGADLKVRGQDDFHAANGLGTVIYIRRVWSLAPDQVSTVESLEFGSSPDNLRIASSDEQAAVMAHVRAVRYVYVPNHARPAELIEKELEPLRSTMVARLRGSRAYRDSSVDDLFAELGRLGERMFGDLSAQFSRGMPNTSISPDLPASFADLVFDVGVRAVTDGQSRHPAYEGSGAQAFMLLHILDLADRTRRGSGFGWMQASVWAIEEPESFLHAGLRAQFSRDLAEYAAYAHRQVFATTHQDEFVRVAEVAFIASRDPSTTIRVLPPRAALAEATRRSISGFQHPLFAFPDAPLVILEGKYDDVYLRSAIAHSDRRPRWRLVAPGAAFGEDIGGDAILQYLKYNRQVLSSRPDEAPIVVLRDWEATDAKKYDNVLSSHPYSRCLVAPESLVNPELDETFVGIERYLPTSLIESVVPPERLGREGGHSKSRRTIKKRDLEASKPGLSAAIAGGGDPGPHLEQLVEWLDDQIVELLGKVPAIAFAGPR